MRTSIYYLVLIFLLLLIMVPLSSCSSSGGGSARCETNDDCKNGRTCIDNRCRIGPDAVVEVWSSDSEEESTTSITDTDTDTDIDVSEVPCTPECYGRECGVDPVCGIECGPACPDGQTCTNGSCFEQPCVPDCSGRICGLDPVCDTPCGIPCSDGFICEEGMCLEACDPYCSDTDVIDYTENSEYVEDVLDTESWDTELLDDEEIMDDTGSEIDTEDIVDTTDSSDSSDTPDTGDTNNPPDTDEPDSDEVECPPYPGRFGDSCNCGDQCSDGLCLHNRITDQSECTRVCDNRADCEDDTLPFNEYLCISVTWNGSTLNVCSLDDTGAICEADDNCTQGLCLSSSDTEFDNMCTIRCESAADCMAGFSCAPVQSDTETFKACHVYGEPCEVMEECFSGLCLDLGHCTTNCELDTDCPVGSSCIDATRPDFETIRVCY